MREKVSATEIKMNLHIRDVFKSVPCTLCGKDYPGCMKWILRKDGGPRRFEEFYTPTFFVVEELNQSYVVCAECGHKKQRST